MFVGACHLLGGFEEPVLPYGASAGDDALSECGKSNAATHQPAPPALITRLASHDAELVRRSAAANPNCPPEVLGLLKQNPEDTVRQHAFKHPAR